MAGGAARVVPATAAVVPVKKALRVGFFDVVLVIIVSSLCVNSVRLGGQPVLVAAVRICGKANSSAPTPSMISRNGKTAA